MHILSEGRPNSLSQEFKIKTDSNQLWVPDSAKHVALGVG